VTENDAREYWSQNILKGKSYICLRQIITLIAQTGISSSFLAPIPHNQSISILINDFSTVNRPIDALIGGDTTKIGLLEYIFHASHRKQIIKQIKKQFDPHVKESIPKSWKPRQEAVRSHELMKFHKKNGFLISGTTKSACSPLLSQTKQQKINEQIDIEIQKFNLSEEDKPQLLMLLDYLNQRIIQENKEISSCTSIAEQRSVIMNYCFSWEYEEKKMKKYLQFFVNKQVIFDFMYKKIDFEFINLICCQYKIQA